MARADPRFPVGRTRLETVGAGPAAAAALEHAAKLLPDQALCAPLRCASVAPLALTAAAGRARAVAAAPVSLSHW